MSSFFDSTARSNSNTNPSKTGNSDKFKRENEDSSSSKPGQQPNTKSSKLKGALDSKTSSPTKGKADAVHTASEFMAQNITEAFQAPLTMAYKSVKSVSTAFNFGKQKENETIISMDETKEDFIPTFRPILGDFNVKDLIKPEYFKVSIPQIDYLDM